MQIVVAWHNPGAAWEVLIIVTWLLPDSIRHLYLAQQITTPPGLSTVLSPVFINHMTRYNDVSVTSA